MKQPWLSVIIPTYNGESYLPFALDSILIQNDPDIECIVVDDGSTDATLSIVNYYQNYMNLAVYQKEQRNWVANTNYALGFAHGKYICFLHQDDFWLKQRLTIIKSLIAAHPDVGLILHPVIFVDQRGRFAGLWRCPLPCFPSIISSHILIEKLLVQNFIAISAPVFRRDMAIAVGGMDEKLWYTADWDFWLKLAALGPAIYYPKPLSAFRIHFGSQTIRRSASLREFREQLEIVFQRNFVIWTGDPRRKRKIQRVAIFSIEVNTALAGLVHRKPINIAKLLLHFLSLRPDEWILYLRYSRVFERIFARLKAFLWHILIK
jgi:glycosyltransferase involved in cell wall biosynthesis